MTNEEVVAKYDAALRSSSECIAKYQEAVAAYKGLCDALLREAGAQHNLLREARKYIPADADGLGQRIDKVLQ